MSRHVTSRLSITVALAGLQTHGAGRAAHGAALVQVGVADERAPLLVVVLVRQPQPAGVHLDGVLQPHHEVRERHVGRQLEAHGVVSEAHLDGEGHVVGVAGVRRAAHTAHLLLVHARPQRLEPVAGVHHLQVHVARQHAPALHGPHAREPQRLLQVRVAAKDAPLVLVVLVLELDQVLGHLQHGVHALHQRRVVDVLQQPEADDVVAQQHLEHHAGLLDHAAPARVHVGPRHVGAGAVRLPAAAAAGVGWVRPTVTPRVLRH
mmetsp:Transcript_14644/g.35380  ORF Transcript_14644/g.35380 Transcript_14644/m.35380 type:complete len:263 (+) Transcript_14644:1097-1885(+)